jgi:hypothetical protein
MGVMEYEHESGGSLGELRPSLSLSGSVNGTDGAQRAS